MTTCFHCGDDCTTTVIEYQDYNFCCNGCKIVFEILNENDLSYYYELEQTPGTSPTRFEGKFDFLKNQNIASKLIDFDEQGIQVTTINIPSIHCSSCIWVLENLNKLNNAVKTSQVNFPQKTVRITFSSETLSLYQLVTLLSKIGYAPHISLDDATKKTTKNDRSLIYKLGVAGFAFGNIMFLSFPEYFEVTEFWLERYKYVFRWLIFIFAVPVVFYSGIDYLTSAYKSIRSRILNIDVPIAIGILVLFIRSTIEIAMDWGTGFLDSMAGLVFFLLLGKFFQQKTYAFLSFERDYKSYFPIAVTRLIKNEFSSNEAHKISEEQAQVYDLKAGDRILIRNNELIPVDGILIKDNALIDYSFVTGEAASVVKNSGDKLFAGGKQVAGVIELEVIKSIDQSYLTQLWSNEIFDHKKTSYHQTITDRISKRFTISIISIAVLATVFWLFYQPDLALNVFTAVLIVACPCAIALAAPFTLGNLLRIFGKNKCYLKNSATIEKLATIDTVVFDKTGTLTSLNKNLIIYEGITLNEEELSLLNSTLRASNHPLSRSLYSLLEKHNISTLDEFTEDIGQGISGSIANNFIKIGSYEFVANKNSGGQGNIATATNQTKVHVSTNEEYKGCYVFQNNYREGLEDVFNALSNKYTLAILSGDNDGEKKYLKTKLPENTALVFNQKPADKLNFIKKLQDEGKKVLMVGDGLNDAGALAQSDVGLVISENVNVFSPACDGIVDALKFKEIPDYILLSKKAKQVINYAFIFSLCYNLIGLGFAITGNLEPVVAAILMPLSSISIVIFTTVYTYFLGKKLNVKSSFNI